MNKIVEGSSEQDEWQLSDLVSLVTIKVLYEGVVSFLIFRFPNVE